MKARNIMVVAMAGFFLFSAPAWGLTQLTPGVPVYGTLVNDGETAYYYITVSAGEHLGVFLNRDSELSCWCYLYIKYNDLPEDTDYDDIDFDTVGDLAVEIISTDEGIYYIRVKKECDSATGSLPYHLTAWLTSVTNHAPNVPTSPLPYSGATGVKADTDLSWQGGDPDSGDTVTYDVYCGTGSPPPLVSSGQGGNTYDPGVLNLNTTYYWQIIAEDSHGAQTAGPTWSFGTEPVESMTILHRDGALWDSISGWNFSAYYAGNNWARNLEYKANGEDFVILHKDGAIYDSATGWLTTTPPYYPGSDYAVDVEVR